MPPSVRLAMTTLPVTSEERTKTKKQEKSKGGWEIKRRKRRGNPERNTNTKSRDCHSSFHSLRNDTTRLPRSHLNFTNTEFLKNTSSCGGARNDTRPSLRVKRSNPEIATTRFSRLAMTAQVAYALILSSRESFPICHLQSLKLTKVKNFARMEQKKTK